MNGTDTPQLSAPDGRIGPIRFGRLELASAPGTGPGEQASSQADVAPATDGAARRPLPTGDFLHALDREMRRADRSGAALSLVVYEFGGQGDNHTQRLLQRLGATKRELDTVGLLDARTVAILCPDTDALGASGFVRKVDAPASAPGAAASSSVYPGGLFQAFLKTRPPLRCFDPVPTGEGAEARAGYPLKRALDIGGASLALLCFAPLMLVTALLIAATSKGPVIFRQVRVGRGGTPFTFYKFRSMVVDADDAIHRDFVAAHIRPDRRVEAARDPASLPDGESATLRKLRADPRVTRIGRIVRKTSIDELPQLFNVLKGEMSLVGPRPPLPYETSLYDGWHLRRILRAVPGITGLWQVQGRSTVTFDEMVRMDIRYQRDCSLGLDLKILLRTVLVVAHCDGAV